MRRPVFLEICRGEQLAIAGPNAGGKTRLVDILTGRYPLLAESRVEYNFGDSPLKLVSENIKYISFRDSYGDADAGYYYQKRWNQHDIDSDMPTAGEVLDKAFEAAVRSMGYGLDEWAREQWLAERLTAREKLFEVFDLSGLMDKYVISLSSGELRKFQLTKALQTGPRMLIMDNPFIGLDAGTRDDLTTLLRRLVCETELQVVLVLSKTDDVPDFVTHVVCVEDLTVGAKMSRDEFVRGNKWLRRWNFDVERRIVDLPEKDVVWNTTDKDGCIMRFNNVSIRYGSRTILENLNWTVHKCEMWALGGRNGSGKSTLLSLVCADNPQSYACDIELFGRKRGTGESIWDIKRHIGYVSPEMHRAYMKDLPSIDIVASGLNDSVGLYVHPKPEERDCCAWWMDVFGIGHLAKRTFLSLSSGEQRLCLLARAFVKDPELLILDEPLHGLDDRGRQMVGCIISAFCRRKGKTMVMVTHYEEELPEIITHRLWLEKHG